MQEASSGSARRQDGDIERKNRGASGRPISEIPCMKKLQDEILWKGVAERDRTLDGRFVFAVNSTGIFCRPSCPSRRPKRENVRFYSSVAEAEQAGFRACLRCRPKSTHATLAERAVTAAKLILDSAGDGAEGTDLRSLAARTGISPFHLQRHFKRIVGMSPKAYLTKKRTTKLRKHLRTAVSVLRATYESGFNSPSRAYAAAGRELGMAPSVYRKQGEGVEILYWISATSLGRVIVGATSRGVCAVMIGKSERELVDQLRNEFPRATLKKGGSKENQARRVLLDMRARRIARQL